MYLDRRQWRHDVSMERLPLSLDELVEHWTVLGHEKALMLGSAGRRNWVSPYCLLGEADRRGLTPLFWQHVQPTVRSG